MNKKLEQLLKDYGYEIQGNTLIRKGIRGWYRDEIVRRVPSVFDAAEGLIPIIGEDEYYQRFKALTT